MDECLTLKNVCIRYASRGGFFAKKINEFQAVNQVSFSLSAGETLALVGGSGCGKSTLAQAIVGLLPWASGEMLLEGKSIDVFSERAFVYVRKKIQMVFQDPYSSLNPRHSVREILTYPMKRKKFEGKDSKNRSEFILQRAEHILDLVGLPKESLDKFPHEFSGGQRQRLGIARALIVSPKILICDEVTSALDVSVQAQILHLLDSLREELGIALLFISHDMEVVRTISSRVLVMNAGRLVEEGTVEEIFESPKHEYTRTLLESVPQLSADAFGNKSEIF